ncbi:hypothetical protein [Nocardia amikacinitolerans]|uniref:hypothetical protein n=1 Tax=Nocardia amikacinitolerans TaxID=756689 RepID=UPI0020A4E23C|nr:hypothetical protein [Nocardia amikacinitolerans]MCP2277544.1 hypothetical protein [Nocardia amikacinitolerans]
MLLTPPCAGHHAEFGLSQSLWVVARRRCSYLYIAPPIAVAPAKQPSVDEYDLTSVRAVMSVAASLGSKPAEAVAR